MASCLRASSRRNHWFTLVALIHCIGPLAVTIRVNIIFHHWCLHGRSRWLIIAGFIFYHSKRLGRQSHRLLLSQLPLLLFWPLTLISWDVELLRRATGLLRHIIWLCSIAQWAGPVTSLCRICLSLVPEPSSFVSSKSGSFCLVNLQAPHLWVAFCPH